MDAMLPYLTGFYGNPHSRTHAYGWESEAAVEKARAVSLAFLPHRLHGTWGLCNRSHSLTKYKCENCMHFENVYFIFNHFLS